MKGKFVKFCHHLVLCRPITKMVASPSASRCAISPDPGRTEVSTLSDEISADPGPTQTAVCISMYYFSSILRVGVFKG